MPGPKDQQRSLQDKHQDALRRLLEQRAATDRIENRIDMQRAREQVAAETQALDRALALQGVPLEVLPRRQAVPRQPTVADMRGQAPRIERARPLTPEEQARTDEAALRRVTPIRPPEVPLTPGQVPRVVLDYLRSLGF